jgi:hypothetical protein
LSESKLNVGMFGREGCVSTSKEWAKQLVDGECFPEAAPPGARQPAAGQPRRGCTPSQAPGVRRGDSHCTTLHHCTALHCTALHCTALHCIVQTRSGARRRRVACRAASFRRAAWPPAWGTRRGGSGAILHCTALHCTTLHCTALHCTAQVPVGIWQRVCLVRPAVSLRPARRTKQPAALQVSH